MLVEIDVTKEGVHGTNNFFEAKVNLFMYFKYVKIRFFICNSRSLLLKNKTNFKEKFAKNKNNDVIWKKIKLVVK